MSYHFLPRTDAGLLSWSANFLARIQLDPTVYGLTADDAADYALLQAQYDQKLSAATDPLTRGGSTILAKNIARDFLAAESRKLARIIQANPAVTNQQKYDLALNVRAARTPIPPPAEVPVLDLMSVSGRTVEIRLHNGTSTRRGKPAGVAGANLFSFVGETPPADLKAWTFQQGDSRTKATITFDNSVAPGSRVWLCARWFNAKLQPGPTCAPVGTYTQYGSPTASAPAASTPAAGTPAAGNSSAGTPAAGDSLRRAA